jgi:hypothetical protein
VTLRLGHPLGRLLPGPPTAGTPFTVAFVLFGLIALAAAVDACRLHPQAGAAARRVRERPVSSPERR